MLVHICCAVDSHYFLQKLQADYPDEKLTGFFYDPNIHPYSEYYLRLLDVKRSCKMLGIDLIEGEYDFEHAKTLVLFCNGPWCSQSPSMIFALLEVGYPPEKIKWYRGGMQDWLSAGMTSTRD